VGQADMFLANGFDDFISKPMDMRVLDMALNKYIYSKQPPDVLAAAEAAAQQSLSVNMGNADFQSGDFQPGDSLPHISGLNAERGLALFDGEMDTYLSALRSYIKNVPDMINKLRVVVEGELPEYVITVHGLKSISGWISADGIQAIAANLEALAKAGDFLGVTTLNETLLSETEAFISELSGKLEVSS
jgi:HPt (histidine-containing phosphotransfer) domain-containing protein